MEKIEFTRFIERYLESRMQPAEQRWFEKELHGNLWLRKELDLRKKTDSFIKNEEAMEFRRKLVQAESLHRNTKPIKRAITSTTAQYAAIFIGLVIISSFIILFSGNQDNSKLADKYVADYDLGTLSRSSSSGSDFEYNTAMEFYNNKDYENAIFWFEKVAGVGEANSIEADYALGLSRMNVKQYEEAIIPLEKVVDHNDNMHVEQAQWFLGLCYLNTNNNEKALTIFTDIAQSQSLHSRDARKALRRIK